MGSSCAVMISASRALLHVWPGVSTEQRKSVNTRVKPHVMSVRFHSAESLHQHLSEHLM
jgi:hypothetical protein